MELPKPLIYIFSFIAAIFIGNLLLLDIFIVSQKSDITDFRTRLSQLASREPTTIVQQKTVTPTPIVVTNDSCPQTCLTAISNATRSAIVRQALNPTVTNPTPTSASVSTKGEYFLNLGTGSVLNTESSGSNWKTIETAQVTFDAANYGSIKSATLEVFMHVQSGGEVHARLFDSTTPSIFWGADLVTSAGTSSFLSGPITNLGAGSKTYKIQMYSTLSTGYLDQARIHIVTQ